jgi:hypothetical protein
VGAAAILALGAAFWFAVAPLIVGEAQHGRKVAE